MRSRAGPERYPPGGRGGEGTDREAAAEPECDYAVPDRARPAVRVGRAPGGDEDPLDGETDGLRPDAPDRRPAPGREVDGGQGCAGGLKRSRQRVVRLDARRQCEHAAEHGRELLVRKQPRRSRTQPEAAEGAVRWRLKARPQGPPGRPSGLPMGRILQKRAESRHLA